MSKIKLLIIDDSALVRQVLTKIFSSDPEIDIVGTASDPYVAARKMKEIKPDVITLDIEMPRMDGITFLQRLMAQYPIPVVVISTLTVEEADTALMALEAGAVEVISKPKINTKEALEESTIKLCAAVKTAYYARVERKRVISKPKRSTHSESTTTPQKRRNDIIRTTDKVVAIGASTGGVKAIKEILQQFPVDCPGVVIVQHMPKLFTKQFAFRLDNECEVSVKEAEDGESILKGHVLIAPGNLHLTVKRSGAKYIVQLLDAPLVNRHRPSVDVLFQSVAQSVGKNAIGVILTGMGSDGAKGILDMKVAGAFTIAQDEQSSVVYGMPKEAVKLNAIDKILNLNQIAPEVIRKANQV
ncbi:MAG TPA: chemotaxis response regulator protein-glutamate methylesterase [Microscillaceae bacterium]|nr:chemotaxis response regulator protein-glutamate methylesterase [Microscillaceae bacterium]